MANMTTVMFPGQGSQYKGMGKDLFSVFPNEIQLANEILGFCIKTLCLEDPHQQLNNTQFTQPALYVINALSYYLRKDRGGPIDFVIGHSLGEYNALLAAKVFDFATGLKLVKKRGELMAQAKGGAMAAVLGLTYNDLGNLLQEYDLTSITIANYNSYRQFVISGKDYDMERARVALSVISTATIIPLKVSGAFHSLHMLDAEHQFAEYLEGIEFNSPTLPVIANYDAACYHPATIHKNLAKHLSNPVQWSRSIDYLLMQGEINFEEVGPGNVLTGLVQRIRNND